jgi:hypothetical protein
MSKKLYSYFVPNIRHFMVVGHIEFETHVIFWVEIRSER